MDNIFNLQKALENYTPFNEKESQHLQKILAFLKSDDNNYDRSNLSGHITGSGYLFNTDFSKVLLTHHKFLNKWLMFGGHSDGDENTFNVATRETCEESGINNFQPIQNSIFDVDTHRIPENKKKNEPEHYHYDIRFAFSTDNEQFIISDESNELRWFTLEEFMQLDRSECGQRIAQKWRALRD